MDDVDVVEDEVEQRRASGCRPVQLTSVVDLHLRHLRLLDLLLDLDRRPLRRLEVLDEGVVAEEVALGRRQPRKKVVLELFQGDLELVLLSRQIGFELLEIRSFLGDDVGEQLVFQTVPRHGEVDQRRLSLTTTTVSQNTATVQRHRHTALFLTRT